MQTIIEMSYITGTLHLRKCFDRQRIQRLAALGLLDRYMGPCLRQLHVEAVAQHARSLADFYLRVAQDGAAAHQFTSVRDIGGVCQESHYLRSNTTHAAATTACSQCSRDGHVSKACALKFSIFARDGRHAF